MQCMLVQVFSLHWFAIVQLSPFAAPHVVVVELHKPESQTAAASEHAPVCNVSLGIGAPAMSLGTQVNVLRLQYSDSEQSPSA
jgi:hypothetical protein